MMIMTNNYQRISWYHNQRWDHNNDYKHQDTDNVQIFCSWQVSIWSQNDQWSLIITFFLIISAFLWIIQNQSISTRSTRSDLIRHHFRATQSFFAKSPNIKCYQYLIPSNIKCHEYPISSNIIRVTENHCRTLLQTRQLRFKILESRLPTRPPVTLSPSTSRFLFQHSTMCPKDSPRAPNFSSPSPLPPPSLDINIFDQYHRNSISCWNFLWEHHPTISLIMMMMIITISISVIMIILITMITRLMEWQWASSSLVCSLGF